MGEQTDTAELVKELDALFARATPGPWVPARRRGSWDWVVVQQSPGMNNEICQMFHDGTDFNEIGEANTSLICMLKTSWPAIRAALESNQARADKLEEELATLREVANHNYEVSQKHLARAESAESSLAQANEALKAVNKLIEWERENGTHFALLGHEVEHVSGLWMDAKNAVITALKAAGKE